MEITKGTRQVTKVVDEPVINIELSQEEASLLKKLTGNISGGSVDYKLNLSEGHGFYEISVKERLAIRSITDNIWQAL